jgi:hypothetical protein
MNDKKYNGWTNYATWRINLEILGDIEFSAKVTISELRDIVESTVFTDQHRGLVDDYAGAFINEVNFYEIASGINEEIETNKQ